MFVLATINASSAASPVAIALLIVVVVAFAWNLGVHYTGAVMGMPFAARSIAEWPALVLVGVFSILGATFASGRVETTVGQNIINAHFVQVPDAIVIVLAAGLLTLLYNYWKVPTSTIQILVFCVIGVALAAGIPIAWATLGKLAIVWVLAPIAAFLLGFAFTRLLDLVVPPAASHAQAEAQISPEAQQLARRSWLGRILPGVALAWYVPSTLATTTAQTTLTALRILPALLVAVGVFASFVLGANDVSNATGAFILTHLFSLTIAGLIGGGAMAVGALTWGRRILHTVAFDVVKMDLTMASAAQGVQALVVIVAVSFGFFTSLNQALIGAMAGTGLARGRETVQRKQIFGILRGWAIGPLSGLALAFALEWVTRLIVH
ncbi:MAG TPA: inorganic phosphate transporter [Ktedonobacterales bacterium]|nr:inorganic phosphate transporter [Ktedonobacterales bacterium]